jgi:hypothetical protein
MFEPFSSRKINIFKNVGLLPYLHYNNKDLHVYELVKKVLSGRIRSAWINRNNRKFIARKRLVKDISINTLLKWIKTYFPEIPIILILRHPIAVASSRTRSKGFNNNVDNTIKAFLNQKDIVTDFLDGKMEIIKKLKDNFLKFIFIWCIENIIPLSLFKNGEVHLAFYENFCKDPQAEIKRMFDFLGKKINKDALNVAARPSIMARDDSAIVNDKDLVSDWKNRVTEDQIKSAMKILKLFKLDKIYSEDTMPNIVEAYKFLNNN